MVSTRSTIPSISIAIGDLPAEEEALAVAVTVSHLPPVIN